jgi:hypothetical protein
VLSEGTLLRWIDPAPGAKPLGIVIAPLSDVTACVLMADEEPAFDLEVFAARPEATGVDAAGLVLERMEPTSGEELPAVAELLRVFGPNWWPVSSHLEGEHEDAADPACLLCSEAPQRA